MHLVGGIGSRIVGTSRRIASLRTSGYSLQQCRVGVKGVSRIPAVGREDPVGRGFEGGSGPPCSEEVLVREMLPDGEGSVALPRCASHVNAPTPLGDDFRISGGDI